MFLNVFYLPFHLSILYIFQKNKNIISLVNSLTFLKCEINIDVKIFFYSKQINEYQNNTRNLYDVVTCKWSVV